MQKSREESTRRFESVQKELNARFEKTIARLEKADQRFDQVDDQFEKVDQRFDQVDDQFEKVDQRMDKLATKEDFQYHARKTVEIFQQVSRGFGATFEGFSKALIAKLLSETLKIDELKLITRQHFEDKDHKVEKDTTDVEIDVICEDPFVIAEATTFIEEVKDVENFNRKAAFIEELQGKKARKFLITISVDDKIRETVEKKCLEYDIEILTSSD
jgi:hypothetical protein